MTKPRLFFAFGAALAAAGLGGWLVWPRDPDMPKTTEVAVIVPALQGDAVMGARVYAAKCASCHGENGIGVEGAGPPFLNRIYIPSHHGDAAFFIAAANGVRAHHWPYGNMPPVEGITEAEVAAIVAYVRALQQANGIF